MDSSSDTIAALATAPGEAGVSIVRISGPDCLSIADRIFTCKGRKPSEREPFSFAHGHVRDEAGDIDDALLLIMTAPRSYTCEDVVEIQCHGGAITSRRILQSAVRSGARIAEPGEFTKRAFLNGRIDLMQAEAVLDLIRARSERAASAAFDQLEGSLSASFNDLYDRVLHVAADLEATLDFPEDELPDPVIARILRDLAETRARFVDLIDTWEEGHLLRDGARIVISGEPNVGKSTLLNTLLGTDRAIVSHMPGTTRDSIEEGFVLDGIPLRIVDTAGLRDTEDHVEKEGIRRTRSHMERADLHLYVVDASKLLTAQDVAHLDRLDPHRAVVVLNKTDLGSAITPQALDRFTAIPTCLVSGLGFDELKEAIAAKLEANIDLTAPPHAVISERHRDLLIRAFDDLKSADDLLQRGREDAIPLAASNLRAALESIGSATGRVYENELLDSIFSRFCIGK